MKFIPFNKLSKKEQEKRNKAKRVLWEVKPITKVLSKKGYFRNNNWKRGIEDD